MTYCKNHGIQADGSYYHSSFEPMKRVYVRVSNTIGGKQERKLVPIGWICPICKFLDIDKNLPVLKGSYRKNK